MCVARWRAGPAAHVPEVRDARDEDERWSGEVGWEEVGEVFRGQDGVVERIALRMDVEIGGGVDGGRAGGDGGGGRDECLWRA